MLSTRKQTPIDMATILYICKSFWWLKAVAVHLSRSNFFFARVCDRLLNKVDRLAQISLLKYLKESKTGKVTYIDKELILPMM